MCGILLLLLSAVLTGAGGVKEQFLEGCSSRCTLRYDKDLSCWNKTDEFFGGTLLGAMLRYAVTQINILIAEKQRNGKLPSVDEITKESIKRMNKYLERWSFDNTAGLLSTKTVNETITALVHASFQAMKGEKRPALLACPKGCERPPKSWFSWSFGSLILSGVLTIVMMIMTFDKDRRDRMYASAEKTAHVVGS